MSDDNHSKIFGNIFHHLDNLIDLIIINNGKQFGDNMDMVHLGRIKRHLREMQLDMGKIEWDWETVENMTGLKNYAENMAIVLNSHEEREADKDWQKRKKEMMENDKEWKEYRDWQLKNWREGKNDKV